MIIFKKANIFIRLDYFEQYPLFYCKQFGVSECTSPRVGLSAPSLSIPQRGMQQLQRNAGWNRFLSFWWLWSWSNHESPSSSQSEAYWENAWVVDSHDRSCRNASYWLIQTLDFLEASIGIPQHNGWYQRISSGCPDNCPREMHCRLTTESINTVFRHYPRMCGPEFQDRCASLCNVVHIWLVVATYE